MRQRRDAEGDAGAGDADGTVAGEGGKPPFFNPPPFNRNFLTSPHSLIKLSQKK